MQILRAGQIERKGGREDVQGRVVDIDSIKSNVLPTRRRSSLTPIEGAHLLQREDFCLLTLACATRAALSSL